MIHCDCCPLCSRKVRWGDCGKLLFVDCDYCSHYYIHPGAATSAYVFPLAEERLAHLADRNWEWGPLTYTEANLLALPAPPRNDDFDCAVRRLLHVIANSHEQRSFYLRFDDPMLMGISSSVSPAELRRLIQEVLVDEIDCMNVTSEGAYVAVTRIGSATASIHLTTGNGLNYIHLTSEERRWFREAIQSERVA